MNDQKIYPSDEQTRFLLCDDIREEKGGKLTLLGYMPQPKAIILGYDPKIHENTQITGFGLLMVFHDGFGKFKAKVSITTPAGKELGLPDQALDTEKKQDAPLNIILSARPFPLNIGIHKFTVTLDDTHVYQRTFEIAGSSQPAPASD